MCVLSGVCRNENDALAANGAAEDEASGSTSTAPRARRLVTSDTLLTISYELLLPELPRATYQQVVERLTSAAFRKRTFPRAVADAI